MYNLRSTFAVARLLRIFSRSQTSVLSVFGLFVDESHMPPETQSHQRPHIYVAELVSRHFARLTWRDVTVAPSGLPRKGGCVCVCVDVEFQLVNIASRRCVCGFDTNHPLLPLVIGTETLNRDNVGRPWEQDREHGAVGKLRRKPYPGELASMLTG